MAKLIGTAGHVDHGKTSLIRALTGIDADRLPEEKRRGLTIDIGFAFIDLPKIGRVSIVDVPGHERFLTNMLVGALGIDVALLCVAADESVMPQTREHLQIIDLLPVQELVVALTRADLADSDIRGLATDEVSTMLADTRFADAPIVPVSSLTGEGLEALRDELHRALTAREDEAARAQKPWFLPIDRAFVSKGYGTVVTGTLAQGAIRDGDTAVIQPGAIETRVRGMRRHSEPLDLALPGMRVALNLGGVRLEQLHRGQSVGTPGALFETNLLDAKVRWVEGARHGMRVRVSIGADEAIGKIFLNDHDPEIAQLRLETFVAAAVGQPLIVRRYSPPSLIAGGSVIVPLAKIRRKNEKPKRIDVTVNDEAAMLALISQASDGMPTEDLCRSLGRTPQSLGEAFEKLKSSGKLVGFGGHWFTPDAFASSSRKLQDSLRKLHETSPTVARWSRDKVVQGAGLPWVGKPLDRIIAHLAAEGVLLASGPDIALPDFQVRLTERQSQLLERVCASLDAAGINVPTPKELSSALGVPPQAIEEILRLGVDSGRVFRIEDGIFYTASGLRAIKDAIAEMGAGGTKFTASEVRDRLKTTRKYVIPLLEYFDSVRFTLRQGEARILQ